MNERLTHQQRQYETFFKISDLWRQRVWDTRTHDLLGQIAEGLDVSVSTPFILFNEVSSVASQSTATIIQYTVPASSVLVGARFIFSGKNKALFTLRSNGLEQGKYLTSFFNFNGIFDFSDLRLEEGDTLSLEVENLGDTPVEFSATMKGRINEL